MLKFLGMPLAAMLLLGAFFTPAARADSSDPAVAQVQGFYDALLDSMKHAKELGVQGRYDRLKPAVEASFDLRDMAALAVGPGWAAMSASDQDALLAAFERLTVANYAKNFDGYGGEKFVVDPATTPRGGDLVVQSKLVAPGQTVPFGYRLRQSGGSWKILDIYLNGTISQLAVQRSEFGATLSAGGAPALTRKLNAQADKLMGG